MGIFGCCHRNAIFALQISKNIWNISRFYYSLRANRTAVWAYWQFINGELWGRVSDGGYNWLMLFPAKRSMKDNEHCSNKALPRKAF